MPPIVYLLVSPYLICHLMSATSAQENYMLELKYDSERFRKWFPGWAGKLENITATSCNETLETYHNLILAKDLPRVDTLDEACKAQISCLLGQLPNLTKQ